MLLLRGSRQLFKMCDRFSQGEIGLDSLSIRRFWGKRGSWKRKRERKNLLSPSPLGRTDAQAKAWENFHGYMTKKKRGTLDRFQGTFYGLERTQSVLSQLNTCWIQRHQQDQRSDLPSVLSPCYAMTSIYHIRRGNYTNYVISDSGWNGLLRFKGRICVLAPVLAC